MTTKWTLKDARAAILDGTAPDGIHIGDGLYLDKCTSLTALPERLTVDGSLYLDKCTSLTALPERLVVGGNLYLNGCTGLTALSEGLTVGDSLYLKGCTGLTALPERLTVDGSLDLKGCAALRPGVYGNTIVPPAHSAGERTVSGVILDDGQLEIRAGCFRGTVKEARVRAGDRKKYLTAINQILAMTD